MPNHVTNYLIFEGNKKEIAKITLVICPGSNPLDRLEWAIVWNNKDEEPINVNFIINNEKMITFNGVKKFEWRIEDIGKIDDIKSIFNFIGS